MDAWGIENNRAIHAKTPKALKKFNKLGSIVDMPFKDGEFDFVFETSLCHVAEKQVPRAVRELNRVVKTGLVFGSVTSDMAPALIDRYDLLRGVKKLGTWWEWSELFFSNGFDLSMHRRDCTDALWAATLAANKGPGQWYADSDSLRYSFFDKVEATTIFSFERVFSCEIVQATLTRAPIILLNARQSHRIDLVRRSATLSILRSCRPCSIGWFHGAQASITG